MDIVIGILILVAADLLVACILVFLFPREPRSHRRRRLAAERAIGKIKEIAAENPGAAMNYLRKMDPFTFEELVLLSFERRGCRIRRNRRYTGDGGIDGRVRIGGQWHYIQCKRYSDHVSLKHVEDFDRLCVKDGKPGLFIHTGKTGSGSKDVFRHSESIELISGSALIELLTVDGEEKS